MRLSPQLRHGITDRLRWQSLRHVQEVSIPPILAGENVIILAPTAGGKTEAAFLPALDRVLHEGVSGVSILYISPLVALLNNQEERATQLADLVGLRAFKWHGGVAASARRHFLNDPSEVLLTTPESLEAMLIGRTVPVEQLFRLLRVAIIDEVHAFAGSDRGAHLIAVLERLALFSRYDVQRVGLSATVQNPIDIGRWFKGRSERPGRVVRSPQTAGATRQALIHQFSEREIEERRHRDVLAAAVTRRKTLVFTESRSDAEELANYLVHGADLDYVASYHSAISSAARQEVEEQMNVLHHACVTCTSAMELGVDIGDLDDVLQWGVPASVSVLLQRWGRSGRRAGKQQHTTLYSTSPWDTLSALSLVTLAHEGWVEPVTPSRRAYHILFQQTLNLILQHYGSTATALWQDLQGITAFADITRAEFDTLLQHLLRSDILSAPGGTLVLGDEGERKLGGRRFQRLIVSFETPEQYTVIDIHNQFEVGTLELLFVEQLRRELARDGAHPLMVLAGRSWQVKRIVDERGIVEVAQHRGGKAPKWQTYGLRLTSFELAQQHRKLLLSDATFPFLNDQATASLEHLRRLWFPILNSDPLPIRVTGRKHTLVTFAGTKINLTIEHFLAPHVAKATSTPFEVTVELHEDQDKQALITLLHELAAGPDDARVKQMSKQLTPLRLSKYQPFLPENMARAIVMDYMFDVEGARAISKAL